MKNCFFPISVFLVAAALFVSCKIDETPFPSDDGEGFLTVSVKPSVNEEVTKAVTAYTTEQTYESQINTIQVLVFDTSSGLIAAYKNFGTSKTGTISTTSGGKTVWAVVNGPDLSNIGSLTVLQNTPFDLSANSTTASAGFVMAGSNTCTVSAGASAPCTISVSRFAARVALVSVTNAVPSSMGHLTVEKIFLSNVVGNQNLAGDATPTIWYNKQGRKDETTRSADHIINGTGYKASCESLTYKDVNPTIVDNGATHTPATPYLFYTYPNSSTTAPAGFTSTFNGERTVLTVLARVNGTDYYYPVVLDDAVVERNTAYTVGLTITGLGSTDPDTPVAKGSISATISVSGWTAGAVYNEEL